LAGVEKNVRFFPSETSIEAKNSKCGDWKVKSLQSL
jgi:hypothetical protein